MNPTNIANNTYCGPAVLSSITGLDTDTVERKIQELRKNTKPVKGMYMSEIESILKSLDIDVEHYCFFTRGTSIFRLMYDLTDGLYIVAVPGHFILIEVDGKKRYICDNHTKSPINLGNSARLQQEVVQVVRVIQNGNN